jgi:hypothetical protein
MIEYHQFCQIKDWHAPQGLKAAQSAQALALGPRTVAYWRRPERFRPRKSTPRTSQRAPFTPQIVHMLDKYP